MANGTTKHEKADHVEAGQVWVRAMTSLKILAVAEGYAWVLQRGRKPVTLSLNELVRHYMQK